MGRDYSHCHELRFFRLLVVLIGGRPSCLGMGGLDDDAGLRAGWLSVFGRVGASIEGRKRSGRPKGRTDWWSSLRGGTVVKANKYAFWLRDSP